MREMRMSFKREKTITHWFVRNLKEWCIFYPLITKCFVDIFEVILTHTHTQATWAHVRKSRKIASVWPAAFNRNAWGDDKYPSVHLLLFWKWKSSQINALNRINDRLNAKWLSVWKSQSAIKIRFIKSLRKPHSDLIKGNWWTSSRRLIIAA